MNLKMFSKTKLAYLIPDFQNPSASTYSEEKRNEVAKIVEKYDGILIEDSPYSELYFEKSLNLLVHKFLKIHFI